MIALPASLPYIRIGSESLAVCKSEWLTKTLTDAAKDTDVPDWIAEDISKGVESYLQNHFAGTVIESKDLFNRIRHTLEKIGLNEVADNIDEKLPPVRISLSDLARRAGHGYELVFFQMLCVQLQSAAQGGATSVECYGLKKCVQSLASAKKWGPKCDQLKDEIQGFLDVEVCKAAHHQPSLKMEVR